MSEIDTLKETVDLSINNSVEPSVVVQTPTSLSQPINELPGGDKTHPSSSLWTERLHATPGKLRDHGAAHTAGKSPLVSSRDLLRAAFASRIVQRDVTGEMTPKTLLLSSSDYNTIRTLFQLPHKSSYLHKEQKPIGMCEDTNVDMCNDFIRSAFSSKVIRSTSTDSSTGYLLNQISEGIDDSSAFSEGVGHDSRQKSADNETQQSFVHTNNSDDDTSISDEHISKLNQCVEEIMALTFGGGNQNVDIQPIVDDALNSGVPIHLLQKIIHGLIDDVEIHQNQNPQDQADLTSHRNLSNSSPLPSIVHLAYASSVQAYIDDVRKNKVSQNFNDEDQGNNVFQAVTDQPLCDDDENDNESSMTHSNIDDIWIDDAVISVQSELLKRAFDLMKNGFNQSDVDTLCSEANYHNLDVTLFQQLFEKFLQRDSKHENDSDFLLPVFMDRAISVARQGQQSDLPISLLLAAALTCGLSTDAIKRKYLKEKKRFIEKRMLDGTMVNSSIQTSSSGHEVVIIDNLALDPDSEMYLKQPTESSSQFSLKNVSAMYNADDDDIPRKHHVAEFHNNEYGDTEFYLMEGNDIEVAFFDESEEVRMIDEAREGGKRRFEGKSIMSQGDGHFMNQSARPDQGRSYESAGLRTMAPVGLTAVHAVSAAIALKLRHQVRIKSVERKKWSTDELDAPVKSVEKNDLMSLQDATRIVKISKLSDDRTWDAPDAHIFLTEKRILEPRLWLGSFTPQYVNLHKNDHLRPVLSSSDIEEFSIVPLPQTLEIALLQLTQKIPNPSVGKMLLDFVNNRDRDNILSERMNVFLSGHEVQTCFKTLGTIKASNANKF